LYNVAVKKPCGNVAKQYNSGFKQKYWWIDRFGKKGKNQQICLCPENRTISASLINVLANIKKE